MSTKPLATVDDIAVRLGKILHEGSPEYERAEAAIWDASVRAVEITETDWSVRARPYPRVSNVWCSLQRNVCSAIQIDSLPIKPERSRRPCRSAISSRATFF